jgi:hypothetical protein
MVVTRAGTGFQDHPTGTNFNADANFNGNGTVLEGGKVGYRGRGQDITVTNLNPSTTYYFRVFTRIGDTWNGGVEVMARPNGGASGGSFTLIAPLYNCATGAITFQTIGGDGSPIEYAAGGITGWTTVATQTVEAGLRDDPKVITLNARQNGMQVSYPFDLAAACTSPTGNRAPIANTPVGNQSATVQQQFSFTIPGNTFSDPDGQPLTLSLTGLPSGLSFDRNTATISGQPTTAGQSTLTLTATDPGNLSVNTQFQLTIGTANTPPLPPPSSSFAITGATTVRCETVSSNLRQLTFTPQYAGLNGQPVTFSVIGELASTTSPGPYTLRIYIDNPAIRLRAQQGGTAGEAAFTYNWLAACTGGSTPPPTNQPPVVNAAIGNQQATVDQAFTFMIPAGTFSDPEGQPLTLALTGLPSGLSFDRNTATISGQPTTAGQSTLTLTATDPGNLSVNTQFQLTIGPAGTPPPSSGFAITGAATVRCETVSPTLRQLTFTSQYAGLNGQPVTFSVFGEMMPTTSSGPYTLRIYIDNPRISLRAEQSGEAAFTYNWLAACTGTNARISMETVAPLTVQVLGNPVNSETADVEIRGGMGQRVQLQVIDGLGYPTSDITIEQAASVERRSLKLSGRGGLYFLRVSTSTQSQFIKLIKQ